MVNFTHFCSKTTHISGFIILYISKNATITIYIYTITVAFYLIIKSIFSLSSLTFVLSSLILFNPKKKKKKRRRREEEKEINSNKFENSSQNQPKINPTKNPLKKPNQPKTHADAAVATTMEAWVFCDGSRSLVLTIVCGGGAELRCHLWWLGLWGSRPWTKLKVSSSYGGL